MGRRKKAYSTKDKLDMPDSFNMANNLRVMAQKATQAPHIKTTTIQAAGLREAAGILPNDSLETD